uniref:Neurotransmitter-gated ion-channel transmembrane domain-containing protein n=1 Tax=Acrobeloides nanus TaxID=290746 RepID=A0A914C0C6_9BILA
MLYVAAMRLLLLILILFLTFVYTVEIVINVEEVKDLDKKAQTLTTILGIDVLDQEERNMKVFTTIFHFPGGTSSLLEEIYYAKLNEKATAKVRYQVEGKCELQWRNFPFDKHDCETKIYLKRISPNQYHIDIDVSETNKKIYQNSALDGLSISNISSYECENKFLQEGVKQCLMLKISLSRHILPILAKFFIPSIAMVFVAWMTLFITRENIVARILTLGISTTMLVFVGWNIEQSLPTLAYFSAADIWLVICCVFNFITFLQVISIHILLTEANKFLALSQGDVKITTKAKSRHFRTESRRKQQLVQKLSANGRATSMPKHETDELMEKSNNCDIEYGQTGDSRQNKVFG